MKILAVCSFGVGSSLVLKMSIEKICKKLDVDAQVDNTDINNARSESCDVIFTSAELYEELKGSLTVPVYPVKKYMDLIELEEVIQQYLADCK